MDTDANMQTHKHVCKNTCPHACTGHTRTCVRTCIPKPASPSSHPRSHRPLAGASDVSSASASCRPQANGSPGRPAPAPQGRPSCGSPGAGAAAACPRPGGPENLAARSCGGPQYGLLCLSGVCPRTSDCTPCASVSLCRGGITGLLWVLPMASPPPSRCWEGLPSRRGTPWPRRGRRPRGSARPAGSAPDSVHTAARALLPCCPVWPRMRLWGQLPAAWLHGCSQGLSLHGAHAGGRPQGAALGPRRPRRPLTVMGMFQAMYTWDLKPSIHTSAARRALRLA